MFSAVISISEKDILPFFFSDEKGILGKKVLKQLKILRWSVVLNKTKILSTHL